VCRVEKTRWARFGRRQGGLDRLVVAHLAHQDDVRILAQRRASAVANDLVVDLDLALVHQALLVPVQELDRVSMVMTCSVRCVLM